MIRLGAIIVGKAKTTQSAEGDVFTADWVDFSSPWNSRGDGYLIPSGSSAGSASAIAAYEWLDVAVGTDSKSIRLILYQASNFVADDHSFRVAVGSVRGPAMWQGVYGLRISHGNLPSDGVMTVARSDSRENACVGGL